MLLQRGQFCTQGIPAMFGDICGCHNRVCVCSWHLVGRGQDAVQHPTLHKMAPPKGRNNLVQASTVPRLRNLLYRYCMKWSPWCGVMIEEKVQKNLEKRKHGKPTSEFEKADKFWKYNQEVISSDCPWRRELDHLAWERKLETHFSLSILCICVSRITTSSKQHK